MSQTVTVSISHRLGAAEARRRIDQGFGDLARQLGAAAGAVERRWEDNTMLFSLSVLGQALSGRVAVAEARVTVEVLLPGVLAMIANRVKGTLQREGQFLLEKK